MKCNCEGCDNTLPEERRYNQVYCSQKCYGKQNRLEAKRRKREKIEKQVSVIQPCRLASCEKEFVRVGKNNHQRYCSEECKKIANRLRSRANRLKAGVDPRVPKKEVIIKEPKCTINPMFLEPRGSRGRKKLGLEDTVYNQNRGYSVEMGA